MSARMLASNSGPPAPLPASTTTFRFLFEKLTLPFMNATYASDTVVSSSDPPAALLKSPADAR